MKTARARAAVAIPHLFSLFSSLRSYHPQPVKGDVLVERAHMLGPVGLHARVQEVDEVDGAGPDLADVRRTCEVAQEDARGDAIVVRGVAGRQGDAGVQDGDKTASLGV